MKNNQKNVFQSYDECTRLFIKQEKPKDKTMTNERTAIVVDMKVCGDGFGGMSLKLDTGERVRSSNKIPLPVVGDTITIKNGRGRFKKLIMHIA